MTTYTPPENAIVHTTQVDFVDRDTFGTTVHLVQGDDKLPVIEVELYENGKPYTVPSGASGNIRWHKPNPDRHYVYNPLLGTNEARTSVYVEVTSQMVSTPGHVKAVVEINLDASTTNSQPLAVIIDRNPIQEWDLISDSENEGKAIVDYVEAAASSASAAKKSEDAAKASASLASTSASEASKSQSAAQSSATAASTSANEAAASAASAEESKDAAASSASAAKKSEDAAESSASKALTSATDAASSASEASGSASAAAISETNASNHANTAAASAQQAKDSQTAAAISEENASGSAKAAQSSATAASGSADTAKSEADRAKGYADTIEVDYDYIEEAKTAAQNSATAAAESASAASSDAKAAKASEQNAKTSQTAAEAAAASASASQTAATASASEAKDAQDAAATSQTAAASSASSALQSATAADVSAKSAEDMAKMSKSYAVGDTGTRDNEGIDNAMFYYEQAKRIAQGLEGSLLPMGTIKFAELQNQTKDPGNMYNISDAFTTDVTFKEGAGHVYPAGTNVYYTTDGYWDCLAGAQVVSVNGQTGVVTISSVTGNAGTADKVNHKLTFTTGSSVVFDGSSDQSVPIPTLASLGAVPTSRKVNNKALSTDISLTAGDVGAYTKAEVDARSGVTSVNSRTGAVTLAKGDVGLGNVDNTTDASKNVLGAKRLLNSGTSSSAYTTFTDDATYAWLQMSGVTGSDQFDRMDLVFTKSNGRPWLHQIKGSTVNKTQWIYTSLFPPPYPVISINGKTGAVTLNATDVGALASTGKAGTAGTADKVGHKLTFTGGSSAVFDGSSDQSVPIPTLSSLGAVPTTRKVNNKALSADISLSAGDVGAVPTTRKVNNKALSADISLSAGDVGAYTKAEVDTKVAAATSRSWDVTVPSTAWTNASGETWNGLTALRKATINVPGVTASTDIKSHDISFVSGSFREAVRWDWLVTGAGTVTLYSTSAIGPNQDFVINIREVK